MSLVQRKTRRVLLYVLLACVVYLSTEGLCYLGLNMLRAKALEYRPLPSVLTEEQRNLLKTRLESGGELSGHHPVLGWSPKPLKHTQDVTINSQGIRSEHDYPFDVRPNLVRISAFGDSYTFGSEVPNNDTWESQLEKQRPGLEVINFGVGAYGLDQAYLRYLQAGIQFHPDIVIIGFMSENIGRNVNVFRPFYSSFYKTEIYTKPRFIIENRNLVLLKNPLQTREDYARFLANDAAVLKELGRHDYWYQTGYLAGPMDRLPSVRLFKVAAKSLKEQLNPVVTREGIYAVNSEGFSLTTRLLESFYCAALKNGSVPVIVIYPDLFDLRRHLSHQSKKYEPLLKHLQLSGLRYLDVLSAFVDYDSHLPTDQLTVGTWGHYSQLGNKIVATHLENYLSKEGLISRDSIKSLAREALADDKCRD